MMERKDHRARYSMAGKKLAFTPQTEYAAELGMELRQIEVYAKYLRQQIKELLAPKDKPLK